MAAILRKLNRGAIKKKDTPERKKDSLAKQKNSVYRNVTRSEKNEKSIQIFREESCLPEGYINGVVFSLFDELTIKKLSACEVKNVNKSYDLSFSTDDPRLGTIENNKLCATCGKSNQDCVGHIGRIDLPVSIIHPFYREFVIMVLKTICFTCNKLLITEKTVNDKGFKYLRGRAKLEAIVKVCEESGGRRCTNPKCGPRPVFYTKSTENESRFVMYKIKMGKKEVKEYITVETIKMKLDAISDSDAKLLGFKNNHPRNFVVNFVPVIPLCARPYIVREGERMDDYLTNTYCNILNKKIESVQQVEDDQKEPVYQDIIDHYRIMIEGMKSSEQTYSKGSKKETTKSIFDRISGKQGIIRKHLLGKRIDYSGRTVIGPNGTLQFNEVALPMLMRQVTIPEFVTIYNIDRLRELGRKGEVSYFCPKKGKNAGIKINFNINRHQLNLGDKVGRYTQEGDIVLANRQPTLHSQSMIGQSVKFQEKGSIGLHLSSCPGLNADFDGDEGNIHFLQTPASQVEARVLMSASNNIVSNSNSKPLSELVYNSVSGAYLLTRDDTLFNMDEFREGVNSMRFITSNYIKNNLSTLFSRANINPNSQDIIPGKILCSVLFPEDFWYRNKDVYIVNGILKKGKLSKKQVGGSHGSIIQCFVKWYGNEIAADFISAASFLFNWYVERSGLSIGISDCTPKGLSEFREMKEEVVRDLNNKFISLRGQTKINEFSKEEEIDKKTEMINNATNIIQKKLLDIIPKNNNLFLMKDSGAKGKDDYTMHMIGFKGQVIVGDSLPVKKLSGGKRWLTTFSIEDNTVYSTGFSTRSFLEGLEPDAFFAMAQEGRLNVIDRQLKTADTGYMQRKVIKAQEDLTVGYDGSVYSQTGDIVQFTYGSGFAVNKMVQDINDQGEKFYSFINTNELCGRVNSKSGVQRYSIGEEIISIFNDVFKENGYDNVIDVNLDDISYEDLTVEDYDKDLTVEDEFDEEDYMYEDDGEDFE